MLSWVTLMLSPAVLATDIPGVPAPPTIEARSYILVDYNTGAVLAERDADTPAEPASLTKIMTTYVAADELRQGHIRLDQTVNVSEKAWRTPGSRMFIEPNKPVTVDELLHGIIIQSGNDASVALAELISGSEEVFADLMTQHAKRLGMVNTSFGNSDGLPHERNWTTARDMAILTAALIREYPEIYSWFAVRDYTYNGISQMNRNKLLGLEEGADGVKTGHTEAAGYCLVGSVQRQGMRLVSVVMGAASDAKRVSASRALFGYGFRFFETHRLYEAGKALTNVRLWKGEAKTVDLGLGEDLWVTIPRGQYSALNATMHIDGPVVAPLAKGQVVGRVNVVLGDKVLAERPLAPLADVAEGGFVSRTVDQLLMIFE